MWWWELEQSWASDAKAGVCSPPGRYSSSSGLILTPALGFPSVSPFILLVGWGCRSHRARVQVWNHSFSSVFPLLLLVRCIGLYQIWESLRGWAWSQIWQLNIVQLWSFSSSITSESIIDSSSLTVQVCKSVSCPGLCGLQWQRMATHSLSYSQT